MEESTTLQKTIYKGTDSQRELSKDPEPSTSKKQRAVRVVESTAVIHEANSLTFGAYRQ